ncbi:MAG: hypothetical protein IIB36_15515 [Gemmatimonadetes bacterium]|nr:hypothetical protein [Gemmatimonadota bacterium]
MKAEPVAIRAFDYSAAVSFGAVAALASSFLVPDLLPTPFALLAGMVIGMASAFPLLGLFSWLLGGFEILMMSMQIGMLAGMLGVMTDSQGPARVALVGALTGLAVQLLLHVADGALHGEVSCE